MKVETLIPTARQRLVTISDTARLTEAAARLGEDRAHLVVVCNDAGALSGVISKTDIVSRISHCLGSSCMETVAAVMTREVICCHPEESLNDVWTLMREKGFLQIPIVDHNMRPLGMLTAHDMLETMLGEVEYEETLLRDYVMCIGYR